MIWKNTNIIMLPAGSSKLYLSVSEDEDGVITRNLVFHSKVTMSHTDMHIKPQHLYFLSDEKPEEGDWVIYDNKPCKIISGREWRIPYGLMIYVKHQFKHITITDEKKIIATTDKSLKRNVIVLDTIKSGIEMKDYPSPSNEFMKLYCKLGGMEECSVEYIQLPNFERSMRKIQTNYTYLLKENLDNTINIKLK